MPLLLLQALRILWQTSLIILSLLFQVPVEAIEEVWWCAADAKGCILKTIVSLAGGVVRHLSVCIAAQDFTPVMIAPTDQGGDITYKDLIVLSFFPTAVLVPCESS